jgi:hypothetical protein
MTETFDLWELQTRTALAGRGIGFGQADPLIDEARAHHAEGAGSPTEVLGSPADFAAAVAADLPPARTDRSGLTAGEYVHGSFIALGLFLTMGTLYAAVVSDDGWLSLTVAGLTGILLTSAGWVMAIGLPQALRAAGRPRAVTVTLVAGALLLVAGATAFTQLPRTVLVELPAWPTPVAALLLTALVFKLPTRDQGAAAPESDAERWYARLGDLLVGRHDLARARADELVGQAREHAAAAGAVPQAEFGSPAEYAATLARDEPGTAPPWWRRPAAELARLAWLTAALTLFTADKVAGRSWWWAALGVFLTLHYGRRSVRAFVAFRRRGA